MADKTVNDPSPAYEEMELDRELPRTLLYGGQRALRAGGEDYLPRYEGELGSANDTTSEYGARLSRSFLVNFYADAIHNVVGRIMSQPLRFSEDMPLQIAELLENIDNNGTDINVFVYRLLIDSLGQGVSHVLVDFQRPGGEFTSEAEEARAGLRPKWVHLKAHNVIEALGRSYNGRTWLERLRTREASLDVDGYDYIETNRVREYLMGNPESDPASVDFYARFNIYEEDAETQDWNLIAGPLQMEPSRKASPEQKEMFVEPPVVPFYGDKSGFFTGRPPLLSLSDLNLQHYQKKSDLDNIERIANVPTLVRIGVRETGEPIEIGPQRVIDVPDGTDLKYLEIQGAGIAHAKDSLRHLEEHIRQVGKEPSTKRATGSELATVRLRDEAEAAVKAQVWATEAIAGVNRCLDLTAGWLGIPTAGSLMIPEDVLEALARPEGFDSVLQLAALGAISPAAAATEAIRYGILDRDFDVDEDAELREMEPPRV